MAPAVIHLVLPLPEEAPEEHEGRGATTTMTTSPMTQGLTQLKPESTLGSDAAAAAAGATPAIDIHVSLPSVTPAAPAAHLASTEEVPLSSQSGEEKRTNGGSSVSATAAGKNSGRINFMTFFCP